MDWKKLPNVNFTKLVYDKHSPANIAFDEYMKSGKTPLQYIVDKYGRNHNLKIMKDLWDYDKKGFRVVVAINSDESREIYVSYEEICNDFNWKSFKILDKNTCIPVELSLDTVAEHYAEAKAKTQVKDRKWFKEHPESADCNDNHVGSTWKH